MTENIIDTFINIENAAHIGAFGDNSRPIPTDAQAIAGNYKLGRAVIYGLPVAIEQPRHSYRTGVDKNGKRWTNRMGAHYGYFSGTKGADGDGVDCFIGFYPQSKHIYIINQFVGGRFDEHKVCLCFPDEQTAKDAYLNSYDKGWTGLQSMVKASISQFKWWLKNGNMKNPLAPTHLPYEGLETMNQHVIWNNAANPTGMTLDKLLYEIKRADSGDNLIFDAVCMRDILEGAESVMTFDALVTPYAKLERKMLILKNVMDRSGGTIKTTALQISDPFKQGGVAQVAVIFELSDGQTVSIFFHNPDIDPRKLHQDDELISWKWLINKKDITIVVAPEQGQDLNVTSVAQRIMRLAEKNSPAFIRANSKRAEKMQAIEDIKTEITGLEQELKDVQHELEVAKVEADDKAAKVGDSIEKHYSELILNELVSNYGWAHSANRFVSKTVSGGDTGGALNPEGDRVVNAGFDETGRYLTLHIGWENVFDIDCRDLKPEDAAKQFNDKVNEWADGASKQPETITPTEQEPNEQENQQAEVTAETEEGGSETSELDVPKPFDDYVSDADGDLFEAAKGYFKGELQGRVVKTIIGDVHLTGGSLKEMKRGMKSDSLKAELIPLVKDILSSGKYDGKQGLSKDRKDTFVAFHFFEKEIEINEFIVTAGVTVGERTDGYKLLAYGLGHSLEERWRKRKEAGLLAGGQEPPVPTSSLDDVSITLDEITAQNNAEINEGLNIFILKVVDKDGVRHPELEDDVGQEGHEVVERSTPSDTDVEQTLIDAYDAAYIKAADKITTAIAEINWDAIIDTNTADIEAHQLKEKVGNGEEINQARKNLEDVGIDYQLAVIAELPGLSLYSQAIVNGRNAIDRIYEAGKKGLIKSGKEKLANLPEDATIEEKAAAVFEAKGLTGDHSKLITAIENKEAEYLRDLIGNTDNKASRTVFEIATGIKLEKTVKGTLAQIDEWAGITPEQRADIEAEKQAVRDADNLLSDLKYAWYPLEQAKAKTDAGIETMQALVIRKFKEGYQRIETSKRGVATAYWMVKSADESIGFKKVKIFNAFLKAALAYGGAELGGMKKALTALGVELESAELTPVELVNAAYAFNATDDFKEWLAESIDKTEQSPFLTAKAMNEAAKRNGADIEWGFFGGVVLDSAVGDDPHIDLIDEDELGATFEPDNDDDAVFDSAVLDSVDQDGYVGKISKDGVIVGRIDMGDDGKALVFVGESGDVRVKTKSGIDFTYSDDDAAEMVDLLLNIPQENQQAGEFENEPETENEPVPVPGDSDEVITPTGKESNEVDNPTEEQINETKAVEDLAPAVTGNTELDKQRAKLKSLSDLQERMKAANKVVNNKKLSDEQKVEQLMAQGYSEATAREILKPDYAGRTGFASYQLTNNNAVIKSTQKRIEQLEAKELAESLAASGERETSYDFDGGTIDLDYGDDRLRVNFDSKPASDMISKLKQNGFKWSPTNTAWQRQLTDNAISTANYLFGTKIQTAASAMNAEVNKPRGDVIVPVAAETLTNPIKAGFEAELEALKLEIDIEVFDRKLDEIAGRIELAGMMDEMDVQLNQAADVLTGLLAEAEKKAA